MAQPIATDALPLAGVVLCCTSLTQDVRTAIADKATQLGAVHKLDLTSDVTHVLVGNAQTPKYKYVAKERPDIKVLKPDFIDKVNEVWMADESVDLSKLEADHALPTFFGLQICLTGFEDPHMRKEMEMAIRTRGGTYCGDLTKQVTHLITAKLSGPKYTHAKDWGITIVGEKWLYDSMQRGMAVDERFYAPELPREQQGVGAFRTVPRKAVSHLGKRTHEEDSTPCEQAGRKKLRRSASTRLGEQSQSMLQSFSQHEVQVDNTIVDAWQDTSHNETQTLRDSIGPKSIRKSDAAVVVERNEQQERHGLFAGYFVLVHGFDPRKTKVLRKAIQENGAVAVDTAQQLEDASDNIFYKSRCLLMPHALPTTMPYVPPGTILVTDWWLERCIYFKQQLDPEHDALSQPLSEAQIPSFEGLAISTTGFDSVDVRMTAEAVKLMGAAYQEQLLPSTSILVCAGKAVRKEKALYASKHGIPVVSQAWLWESLRSKKKASLNLYKIELPAYNQSQLTPGVSNGSPVSTDVVPAQGTNGELARANDYAHPKRLSNTRKRHATPSLMLKSGSESKPSESAPKKSRHGPFVHEDDDEAPISLDVEQAPPLTAARKAQPLRELSPNASQRSESAAQAATKDQDKECFEKSSGDTPTGSPAKRPAQAPDRQSPSKENIAQPMQKLTSDLATLINHSRVGPGQVARVEPQKRKHRPLGRNLSGTSLCNRSGSASASPALPDGVPEEEVQYSEADGFAPSKQEIVLPPSTQLGYDSPEAEELRKQMSLKMGGKMMDEDAGKHVASVGTVRDSEGVARSAATGAARAAGARKGMRART